MGKHLKERQECFIQALLKAKKTYKEIKKEFICEFGETKKTLGNSAITRVANLLKISENSKAIKKVEKRGRKKLSSERDLRIIRKVIKKNRRKSWADISDLLCKEYGIQISARTLQRRAHDLSIRGHVAKKSHN